jgi:hypothetical protein
MAISDQAPCLGKCHALANVMYGKLSWRVNMTVGKYPVLENILFWKLSCLCTYRIVFGQTSSLKEYHP